MAFDRKYGKVLIETDSVNNPLHGTDEPVFILRAQDKSSLNVLRDYADLNPSLAAPMKKVWDDFKKWQAMHPELVKQAD